MLSGPNFVEKVLQSGHFSTAEHASLMLPAGVFHTERGQFFEKGMRDANRFFDFPPRYVAGNMRSWLEYMAVSKYNPLYEYIVAVFPDVFPSGAYVNANEMYEFSEQAPVNVPFYEEGLNEKFNLYLLAVNPGEMNVSRRPTTILKKPWMRFTWLIEGVSRSLTHQLVRHRGASFSQESQRYVEFKGADDGKLYLPFVYPESWTLEQKESLYWANNAALTQYEAFRKDGGRREDARFILPNGAATRLVTSFNTKELLHFLDIRCAKDAQWEIRRLAIEMLKQAYLAFSIPEFSDLMVKHDVKV